MHNNYLDILFSVGLFGLVLFLSGWFLLPLAFALKRRDYLTAIMLLSFAAALVTEVYLSRTFGAMMLGFFVPFLSGAGKENRQTAEPKGELQPEPALERTM